MAQKESPFGPGTEKNPTSEAWISTFGDPDDGSTYDATDVLTGGGGGGKILFTSDWHYNEAGGRPSASVASESETKSNLDEIIDDANNNFNPDHVFVGGDMADQNLSNSDTEFITWLENVIDYFENTGGTSGNGIDAPVTYLVGDHEYGAVGGNSTLFDVFGWADESESWGAKTVGGVKYLHLNTVVGELKGPTHEDKTIPSDEIAFIEQELSSAEESGTPVMTLSHVPLWGGVLENNETKDTLTNGDEVLATINDSPMFAGALAAHLHHETSFQRVRSIEDAHGNRHLINCTPNNWMDDTTANAAYTRVRATPSGSWAADVPITSSKYATSWAESGKTARRRSVAQSMVADQSQVFRWLHWESVAGWDEVSSDGTFGIDTATGALELSTGATAGNTETIRKMKADSPCTRNLNFDAPIMLRFAWEIVSGPSSFDISILAGGGTTQKHMGFLVRDEDIHFDMDDGSRNVTDISTGGFYGAPFSNGRSVVASWPGSVAEYWEGKSNWDGSGSFDESSTTNNVPSGNRDGDVLIEISLTTDANTDLVVRIHELELFVGSIGEPVTIKTQSTKTRS